MSEGMVKLMANTSPVYARIDKNLKDSAERILSQLGISPSSAIQMLYSQIILRNGMPFDVRLPLELDNLTEEEFDRELKKGIDSLKDGISAQEVEKRIKKLSKK